MDTGTTSPATGGNQDWLQKQLELLSRQASLLADLVRAAIRSGEAQAMLEDFVRQTRNLGECAEKLGQLMLALVHDGQPVGETQLNHLSRVRDDIVRISDWIGQMECFETEVPERLV